jgi:regulator of protease activity HflC (stomatin/prohibitin superfamily)
MNLLTEGVAGTISLRVKALPIVVQSKTKDNVNLDVKVNIHYQIIESCVETAFYRLSNPTAQITAYANNVIRGQIPIYTVDEVFLMKDEIAKAVKMELDAQMEKFGFNIVASLIVDVDPSANVKQSMNQINTNSRLRIAMGYKAEADKISIIKEAEAEAEAKRLSGVGLAEQRKAAIAGLQASVESFQHSISDVSAREVMGLLLMNQYFDALKDIVQVGKSNVVFVPNSSNTELTQGVMAATAGSKGGKKN